MFDQIEKLKQDFTDKFVVVDATVPELKRFDGHVGQVKTINMNGRALVQFEAWNNIGWYDIEVNLLKVVPKPDSAAASKKQEPKGEAAPKAATAKVATEKIATEKIATAPATGEKKLSPLEMARMQGAAKGASAKSTDEIAAPAEESAPAAGAKKSTADILAAARAVKAAPAVGGAKPAAAAGAKMSTADILAAARAKKAAEASGEPAAAASAPAPPQPAEEKVPAAPVAPAMAKPKPAVSKPAATPGERLNVPDILAWCREHDAK